MLIIAFLKDLLYCTHTKKHYTSMSLEKELQFFKKNQADLLKKYEGKFLVIKDEKVAGTYESEVQAYTEAQKKLELGTFLIQQCLPGNDSFSQTYHSRAIFV